MQINLHIVSGAACAALCRIRFCYLLFGKRREVPKNVECKLIKGLTLIISHPVYAKKMTKILVNISVINHACLFWIMILMRFTNVDGTLPR